MEQIVECVIAGGPQHGTIRRQFWDPQYPAPLSLVSEDGHVCLAAARRPVDSLGNRFILLHPLATGQQFMAALTISSCRTASAHVSLAA
ncbi:hypothetical protein [Rhodanobacter umsongensis]